MLSLSSAGCRGRCSTTTTDAWWRASGGWHTQTRPPFSGFLSHYVIQDRYGRPGKGNDKGSVEGLVGWARRNFMVPLPRFASWDDFNALAGGAMPQASREHPAGPYRDDRTAAPAGSAGDGGAAACALRCLRTGDRTGEFTVAGPLPDQRLFGARRLWPSRCLGTGLCRSGRDTGCGGEVIARHPRCYDREDMVFDPVHYLPLLEQKIGALDQAAPLAEWDLPAEFQTLAPDGSADDQGRPPGVRSGSAAAGGLRDRRPPCRGQKALRMGAVRTAVEKSATVAAG